MGARFAGRMVRALAVVLALALMPAGAQQPPADTLGLAAAKLQLDEIEAAAGRESTSGPALVELRARAVRLFGSWLEFAAFVDAGDVAAPNGLAHDHVSMTQSGPTSPR